MKKVASIETKVTNNIKQVNMFLEISKKLNNLKPIHSMCDDFTYSQNVLEFREEYTHNTGKIS